jgi:hypothetical protein
MAIKLIVVESTTSQKAITINSSQTRPWWSAFFAITMVQNTLTTGEIYLIIPHFLKLTQLYRHQALLVYRIWKVEKRNEKYRSGRNTHISSTKTHNSQPRLRQVIRVIAESGLAYTTLVFLTFIVSVCNSNALYPLSDAVGPLLLSADVFIHSVTDAPSNRYHLQRHHSPFLPSS